MKKNYTDFLKLKRIAAKPDGFAVADLNAALKPFQSDIVKWALKKGRAAIFADTGLGKTFMQCEWADKIAAHTGGKVIIFAPLCVATQTIKEAAKWGIRIGPQERVNITNYEQFHKVSIADYQGVVLDESSILKSVDGKTKRALIDGFRSTPYRLCCTATPAPNDPTELGNHSAFLGILTQAEMLATFFVNRGEGNRSWDLKGHAHEAFYQWLASWAIFVRKPSDIGHENEGYDLPPLTMRNEIIDGGMTAQPGRLFADKLKGIGHRGQVES